MPQPVLILLKFAALAFTALLPVINPVGSALVFLGIVGEVPAPEYRRLARTVSYNTAALLFVVDLAGALILKFFGISLPVVQLAGGGVLAAMGWGLLNQKAGEEQDDASAVTRRPGNLDASAF